MYKRQAEINTEFQKLLKAVSADNADGIDEERITELMNEKQRLTVQLEQYAACLLYTSDFVVWTGHFVSLLSVIGGWGGVLPPHFGQKKAGDLFSDFLLVVPLCGRRVFNCKDVYKRQAKPPFPVPPCGAGDFFFLQPSADIVRTMTV